MVGFDRNDDGVELRELGAALRATRTAAGLSTRQIAGFSTAHVSRVETGYVIPSRRFIDVYVGMGGDPGQIFSLWDRARLVGRRHSARRPTDEGIDSITDPLADPLLLRRGYSIQQIDDEYVIGSDRRAIENNHRVRIRPVLAGARYFPFRHLQEEDPRRGVSTVVVLDGCELPVLEEGPTGTVYAVLDFADCERDETGACLLAWSIKLRTTRPALPQVGAGASSTVPRATIRVRFAEPAVPTSVWWYRDFDSNAATLRPDLLRLVNLSADDSVRHEWRSLNREWWGLSWLWPDPLTEDA